MRILATILLFFTGGTCLYASFAVPFAAAFLKNDELKHIVIFGDITFPDALLWFAFANMIVLAPLYFYGLFCFAAQKGRSLKQCLIFIHLGGISVLSILAIMALL
jgi:hypothetical protein